MLSSEYTHGMSLRRKAYKNLNWIYPNDLLTAMPHAQQMFTDQSTPQAALPHLLLHSLKCMPPHPIPPPLTPESTNSHAIPHFLLLQAPRIHDTYLTTTHHLHYQIILTSISRDSRPFRRAT